MNTRSKKYLKYKNKFQSALTLNKISFSKHPSKTSNSLYYYINDSVYRISDHETTNIEHINISSFKELDEVLYEITGLLYKDGVRLRKQK